MRLFSANWRGRGLRGKLELNWEKESREISVGSTVCKVEEMWCEAVMREAVREDERKKVRWGEMRNDEMRWGGLSLGYIRVGKSEWMRLK